MGKGEGEGSCDSISSVSHDGLERGVHHPSISFSDHYYPGHTGSFQQLDTKNHLKKGGCPNTSDNTSLPYYAAGFMGIGGNQTYGSKMGQSDARKSNSYNVAESNTNTNQSGRNSTFPSNSRVQQSSNFSKPIYGNHPLMPPTKLGSGVQSNCPINGFHPASKFSLYTNQSSSGFMQSCPAYYRPNGRGWNDECRYKLQQGVCRNGEFETSTEMIRGPRFDQKKNSTNRDVEEPILDVERDKYNLPDFEVEYDDAKFYVIKPISEDDVHKSIKYNVWSSTPNGNRKLDAVFHEADAITSETGKTCPVFLFFSVNKSGQFLGVAEMVGPVDFGKDMDFWQVDPWSSFFPVIWHIIKDVPSTVLQHVVLENNECKPVTHSRDTQEIQLKQGLEMLNIFKSYSERTSILEDFNFYEDREKSLRTKRKAKSASRTDRFGDDDDKDHFEGGEWGTWSDYSSLASRTESLSLNS